MTKKRIGIYLLFSFGIVWGMMILYMIMGGKYEDPAMEFILTLSMLSPAIAVVLTRKITKEGFRMMGEGSMMLGMDFRNRKWIWYVVALTIPILYFDLGILCYYMIFPKAFDLAALDGLNISRHLLFLVPLSIIAYSGLVSFGALGEEIGWRGYLYPKLEELYGNTKAILLGGIIWGVWHFPGIYMGHNFGHGYFLEPWSGFLVFTLFTIAVGSILCYITKKTGSVWPAAFMHAVNNAASGSSVLGMAFSEENLPDIALETPLRLFIISIPVLIIGILAWMKMRKNSD